MPTREQLLSRLAGAFKAPNTRFASSIKAINTKFASVLSALQKKMSRTRAEAKTPTFWFDEIIKTHMSDPDRAQCF